MRKRFLSHSLSLSLPLTLSLSLTLSPCRAHAPTRIYSRTHSHEREPRARYTLERVTVVSCVCVRTAASVNRLPFCRARPPPLAPVKSHRVRTFTVALRLSSVSRPRARISIIIRFEYQLVRGYLTFVPRSIHPSVSPTTIVFYAPASRYIFTDSSSSYCLSRTILFPLSEGPLSNSIVSPAPTRVDATHLVATARAHPSKLNGLVTFAAQEQQQQQQQSTIQLHPHRVITSPRSQTNSDVGQKNVLRVRHMVGQRRPSRSCSILIWGGFLLLYAALTAIIDCTQNNLSTPIVPLMSTNKPLPTENPVNTEDSFGSGDGSTIFPTPLILQNENKTTENSSVLNPSNTTIINSDESEKCTPPAIKQFPRPFMRPSIRRRGGVLIHIILCIYSFLGLAIVCDHYFVKSLDRICEELKVSPDVAGATFMAAGSSAPELATVVIGVFLAKDDIGVSGVIGSAVFNIMFVIAVCGLASTTVTYLNWWPLCRDSFFYTISILIMLLAIYNETISWIESSMLLLAYVIYCVALYYNLYLEAWANTWNLPFPPRNHGQINELFADQSMSDAKEGQEQIQLTGTKSPSGYDTTGSTGIDHQEHNQQSKTQQNPDYYIPKVYHEADEVNPLLKPENGNIFQVTQWFLMYPIYFTCYYTMPDCRKEIFKNWYGLTFVISMLWISVYSYIMVWMITVIGNTLGIPDTVMGLTFVAAGVSVPDALSSLAVVKEGYGDMAVSNAIGSNVFDILVCLGLPWFLQTAVFNPGSTVKVYSKGLTYCTLTLLSTVVFLLVATHMNGWKLDRKFGAVLMLWYLIFIAIASLYEMNGTMNPPSCLTDY